MRRSFTTRLLAFLYLMVIGGAQIYAQISSQTAGTEKWQVQAGQKIQVGSEEYDYYTSANVSLRIGANEKWNDPKNADDNNLYLSSQGNCYVTSIDGKNTTNAGYIPNAQSIILPDQGNYFHFTFHTKGIIKLAFCITTKKSSKNIYIAKMSEIQKTFPDDKQNSYNGYVGTFSAISTKLYCNDTEINANENGYFAIGGNYDADKTDYFTIEINTNSGDDYYIWANASETLGIGSYTFTVNPDYIFTPWTPYVHEQVELGKSPSSEEDGSNSAPTGVENISFMYGGWLNHPNAVLAATWDGKKWGLEENGTENTKYTINNTTYTDKWTDAIKEADTKENLTTLDGYDSYTEGCGNAPTDELGKSYSAPNAASSTVIPCRGTYYKFEPIKNGFLTVYVRQANNNPLFLVNEGGLPQESVDYHAGQDGVTITKGNDNSYTTNKLSACRYSFNVKAGKTYVLFQNNESLGLYGFTFGADETESSDVTIEQDNGYTFEAKDNANVTLTQKLNVDKWNAICLPFSMTEKQVRETFGTETRIAEFKNIENSKANFKMHYYQVITAGKPCLIKPSGTPVSADVTLNDNQYYISGVTIDAEKTQEISDPNNSGFTFVGTYDTETMPINSHFLGGSDGKLYYITKAKPIGGLKAYLKPTTTVAMNAKLSVNFNDDNTITGIKEIKTNETKKQKSQHIYNINGQLVGTIDNMPKLSKGIYIINGKKHIIK